MGLQEVLSDELVTSLMNGAAGEMGGEEEEMEESVAYTTSDRAQGRDSARRTKDVRTGQRLDEEEEEMEESVSHPPKDRMHGPGRHKKASGERVEEEIEITEDNLEEIVKEFLKVDVSPVNSGWAGVPERVAEHNDELMLAQSQDDEFKEKYNALKKAYKKLTENNGKLKQLVLVAKDKLEEVNLSNAKLLYTNEVLNSNSLNERQKNKIVEAISNTRAIKETKVIYETLQSAVGSTQRSKPQSLSEAVSRPSMSLPSRSKRNNPSPAYDRMKVLAGIMDR